MKTIRPRTWKGFIKAIDDIRSEYGVYRRILDSGETYERNNNILFRGQSNQAWPLATTLERKTNKPYHVAKYMHLVKRAVSEIESFTGASWNTSSYPDLEKEIEDNQDVFSVHLPCYDYLVYLRHHGFPSPLLDWTESPFIAAYFAYISNNKNNSAVYCYIERPAAGKGGRGGDPMISVKGPFVKTHKRHFAQKAWYTVATKWNSSKNKHYFCQHENVFNKNDPKQDVLIKVVLPKACRDEALQYLNDHNINHFTLFQSEESLIKAIETKEFDIKNV